MFRFFFILLAMPLFAISQDICPRPTTLIEFEEKCKTDPEVTGNTGSFLEQIQENIQAAVEQTKKLFNIARKRLGIKYNEESSDEKDKKCEYYQCIFRKMDSLGANMYPNMTLVESWVNANVDDSLKESTLVKVESCFHALAMNIATDITTSLINEEGGIKLLKQVDETNATDYGMGLALEDPIQIKSACDISTKLMMCLNTDMKCSVFQYP